MRIACVRRVVVVVVVVAVVVVVVVVAVAIGVEVTVFESYFIGITRGLRHVQTVAFTRSCYPISHYFEY